MVQQVGFLWWFLIGVGITSSLLLLQKGLGEAMHVWTSPTTSVFFAVLGGGLLAGCLALACERIYHRR